MREQRRFHWVVRVFLSGSAQGCALDSIVAARVTSHHARGATVHCLDTERQSIGLNLKIIHSHYLFNRNNPAPFLVPLADRQPF
jgi:hypothetical protein